MTSLVDVIYISHESSQPLRKSIEFSRNGESQYKVKVKVQSATPNAVQLEYVSTLSCATWAERDSTVADLSMSCRRGVRAKRRSSADTVDGYVAHARKRGIISEQVAS